MTDRSGWRPENAVLLAVLLMGLDVLLALLLWLGVLRIGAWYGAVLLVAGLAAAGLILSYSRKLRRAQRPEWLETRAWRKGLQEKLKEGQQDEQQR